MSLRVLLTGASGYLGGVIAKKLAASGCDVIPMTRKPKEGEREFVLGHYVSAEMLAGADALIHCAYDFAPIEWRDIKRVNIEGSRALFVAAKAAGVRRIVLISTISAFEGCKSNYGRAKLEIEAHARATDGVIIRPGLIYGDKPAAMVGRLVQQVKTSAFVPMPGDGRQMMYTVHEDDLTDAILRAATMPSPPTAPITVANATPIAFRDIMLKIGERLGRNVTPIPVPWRAMWYALRGAEALHVPIGLRSDSLVSLVNQDTAPNLNAEAELGVRCRPFDLSALTL